MQQEQINLLAKLAQGGCKTNYRSLLHECAKIAQKSLYKKISDKNEIDDIIQETLISVHKALHTYDTDRNFLPWFYAILHYRTQDHLRSMYKKRDNESEITTENENSIFEQNQTDSDVTNQIEIHEQLKHALDHLNEKQRNVIKLLKIDGYSVKEVAAILTLSESDVKVTSHRAMKKMEALNSR